MRRLLGVLLLAVLSRTAPAEPPPALGRIKEAREYTLHVTLPEGREKVLHFVRQNDNKNSDHEGWGVVPHLLEKRTAPDGKGDVSLVLEFPDEPKRVVEKSLGNAEGVFLVKHFGMEKDAATWLDKVAPLTELVAVSLESALMPPGELLDAIPPALDAAVGIGKKAYDEKRPELIRRFSGSFLFYPPAAEATWAVSKSQDPLRLSMACADLMYAARFSIELRRLGEGKWEVARILGKEDFKGE